MQFYQQPELYFVLRSPSPRHYEAIRRISAVHLRGPLASVMDPACGPATWLLPFARDGLRVAGNDLYPEMVQWAKRTLAGHPCEITQGDMCDLHFRSGPFDVALEVGGALGHLPDAEALGKHLRSVLAHLRPGGLYLLLLFVACEEQLTQPLLCQQSPWLPVPGGGTAAITYEIVRRDPARRTERMRRTVRCNGVPGCPPQFADDYEVRCYSPAELREILARLPEAELAAAYEIDEHDQEHPVDLQVQPLEAVLVLRRLPSVSPLPSGARGGRRALPPLTG
jgi:SAM-dependent methyltransferase